MGSVFEAAMANAYRELSENQRLLFGENLLKTYLLEFEAEENEPWWMPFRTAVSTVSPTDDHDLVTVEVTLASRRGRPPRSVTLVLDRVAKRFAFCHSLAEANQSDAAVNNFLRGPHVDTFWLSSAMLEQIGQLGALRGFSTRFDGSRFPEADRTDFQQGRVPSVDVRLPVESLNLKLWGTEAPTVLEALRATHQIRRAISVASVRLRYVAVGARDLFSLDDVDYTGRITTRGTSYAMHRDFAMNVTWQYERRLDELESGHRIRVAANTLAGEPLIIRIDPPMDPHSFVTAVFRGVYPFRLIGLAQSITKDYLAIPAVDLHGGHRLDFEVAPDFVRIFMRGSACANTVLRFEANLQHYLSSDSQLLAGHGAVT